MNYLTWLPKEIMLEIMMYVNYRYIKAFGSTCFAYYAMCDYLIKHKQRLNKNYPRLEGKCKIHKQPFTVVDFGKNLKDCIQLTNASPPPDVVKGDIVEYQPQTSYCPYRAIYNGQEFEEMGYNTEGDAYFLLDYYTVIENDVPLTYYQDVETRIH